MAERIKRCEVVNEPSFEGGSGMFFDLECGESYVAYESLFSSTRVTGTLSVFLFESTCTFAVTVESNDQAPIVRTIAPEDTNRTINLTVDCLEKITFSCSGSNGSDCEGFYSLLLRWCKCC